MDVSLAGLSNPTFEMGPPVRQVIDKRKARMENRRGNASTASDMKKKQMTPSDKQLAFMDELAKYEEQWVAILRNGDEERIVGSGKRLKEAKLSALSGGFRDVVFMKVPSSHKIFVGARW